MKIASLLTHPSLVCKTYENPWKDMKYNNYDYDLLPADGLLTMLCKFSFNPSKNVASVKLRATALGIFDIFINGKRVCHNVNGDLVADEYKPGWTDYRKRVNNFSRKHYIKLNKLRTFVINKFII